MGAGHFENILRSIGSYCGTPTSIRGGPTAGDPRGPTAREPKGPTSIRRGPIEGDPRGPTAGDPPVGDPPASAGDPQHLLGSTAVEPRGTQGKPWGLMAGEPRGSSQGSPGTVLVGAGNSVAAENMGPSHETVFKFICK